MLMNIKNKSYKFQFKKDDREKLVEDFANLQRKAKESGVPVIIIVDGWECSGKGFVIHDIVKEVNHKYVKVRVFGEDSDIDKAYPKLYKFWNASPEKGDIVIFDRSFYHDLMFPMDRDKFDAQIADCISIEKQLCDDGVLFLKFFLHIDRDIQKKRIKEYEKDGYKSALLSDIDYEQNKHYDKYLESISRVLKATDIDGAKWHIIPADSMKDASAEILGISISEIGKAIEKKNKGERFCPEREIELPEAKDYLGKLNYSLKLSKEEYKENKKVLLNKLQSIGYEFFKKKISAMIIFEGVDAAGKGGAIQRLTMGLDPRGYDVVPISKPTQVELNHHYLWRFWKEVPEKGRIVVFDRSWYGRVLVERIEKLATEFEWKRAYEEINTTEKALRDSGILVLKFFISIEKEEQLKRFNARKDNPEKSYKLTDEDWRNREKWDLYIEAYNDMLTFTDTKYAPWILVPGNDKYYARIKVMEETVKRAAEFLKSYKKK